MSVLLEARGLVRSYPWRGAFGRSRRGRRLVAVAGVDLDVVTGEALALVGESGSGKSTLGRTLIRLDEPDAGTLRFAGEDLLALAGAGLRRRRREFQMVFQHSASAVDPRQRVAAAVAEPLAIHGLEPRRGRPARVAGLLESVGLDPALGERFPHQLSGGQRQRVGIARAVATEPRLLILDEPVSSLDATVRAQILGLLVDLRARFGLTLVLISHDLAVVAAVADRVAVVYLGRVVEIGGRDAVLRRPRHPYTQSLLAAVPVADPRRRRRPAAPAGEVPSLLDPPAGCPYHPRCPLAVELCRERRPELATSGEGHAVACHRSAETAAGMELSLPDFVRWERSRSTSEEFTKRTSEK